MSLYRQGFQKETVVPGDGPWFPPSHFTLKPVHFNSDARPQFNGAMWTLGNALNSRASRKTQEGNRWIALLTALLCPLIQSVSNL